MTSSPLRKRKKETRREFPRMHNTAQEQLEIETSLTIVRCGPCGFPCGSIAGCISNLQLVGQKAAFLRSRLPGNPTTPVGRDIGQSHTKRNKGASD